MISSTSSSERVIAAVLACLLPALAIGVGVAGLLRLSEVPDQSHPVVQAMDRTLDEEGIETLVFGNSVTMAGLDPATLTGLEAVVGGRVVSVAHRGAQPAHWVLALRQRVFGQGHRPSLLMSYVPLHSLTPVELAAEAERALFVALLTESAPELTARALGGEHGQDLDTRLDLGRDRARVGLVELISHWPARLAWGLEAVENARERRPVLPNDPAERPSSVPGAPDTRTRQASKSAAVEVSASFVPDLVGVAREYAARLVVVVPVINPTHRQGVPCQKTSSNQDTLDYLLGAGVDVIDLSWAPLAAADFETRFHLKAASRPKLAALVEGALDELGPPAAQGRWIARGCAVR